MIEKGDRVRVVDGVLWIGQRAVPWAKYRTVDVPHGMFLGPDEDEPWYQRQALVMLESAWTVSIVWGDYTYSDNHQRIEPRGVRPFEEQPLRVEVAVMDREVRMVDWPGGDQIGAYLNVDEVCAVLDAVSGWPTGQVGEWPAAVVNRYGVRRGEVDARRQLDG